MNCLVFKIWCIFSDFKNEILKNFPGIFPRTPQISLTHSTLARTPCAKFAPPPCKKVVRQHIKSFLHVCIIGVYTKRYLRKFFSPTTVAFRRFTTHRTFIGHFLNTNQISSTVKVLVFLFFASKFGVLFLYLTTLRRL